MKQFMWLATGVAVITMAGLTLGASNKRPNIIFFITDDQVKQEIGCYGGKVLTPHLDRLAREGMRMDNAHVVSTVCTPSRYSMFDAGPYVEKVKQMRVLKRGFEVIGAAPAEAKPRSKAGRKAAREERKLRKKQI